MVGKAWGCRSAAWPEIFFRSDGYGEEETLYSVWLYSAADDLLGAGLFHVFTVSGEVLQAPRSQIGLIYMVGRQWLVVRSAAVEAIRPLWQEASHSGFDGQLRLIFILYFRVPNYVPAYGVQNSGGGR